MGHANRKGPIRVGMMLDTPTVPAWIASIIDDVLEADFVSLELVVVNAEQAPAASWYAQLRRPRALVLFKLYLLLDAWVFRARPDAFARVDCSARLRNVKTLRVTPTKPKPFEHRFEAGTVSAIRAHRLDVMVRFGFNVIRGEILDCARYGVWSYHHGDNRRYRGVAPLFWEIYERNPVSGTMLQILTEELDAGRVLYRTSSATNFTSLYLNRNPAYWRSSELVLRGLRDLHGKGGDYIARLAAENEAPPAAGLYHNPTNRQMLIFLWRLALHLAREAGSWVGLRKG